MTTMTISWRILLLLVAIFFCLTPEQGQLSVSCDATLITSNNLRKAGAFMEFEKRRDEEKMGSGERQEVSLSLAKRILRGPGSSPPSCISKCGDCKPCVPVLVEVPPGTQVIANDNPLVWRCKCGGKLYIP